MTFKEISAQLDLELADLDSKKKAMDAANAKAQQAVVNYQNALAKTQELRQSLISALEEVMPPMPTNVRVSGGRVA